MRSVIARLSFALVACTVAALLAALQPGSAEAQAAPAAERWVWPLTPTPPVARPFESPESPWAAGHRGVDLLGDQGQQVLAIGDGAVSFAGTIAGRGVVVVSHGALRSTYEPVTASLPRGARVSAGQVIGLLQSVQSHCLPSTCLHLGVRRGEQYVDPLSLLGPRGVRLKPLGGAPPAPSTPDAQSPLGPSAAALASRAGAPPWSTSGQQRTATAQRHRSAPLTIGLEVAVAVSTALALIIAPGPGQARG